MKSIAYRGVRYSCEDRKLLLTWTERALTGNENELTGEIAIDLLSVHALEL